MYVYVCMEIYLDIYDIGMYMNRYNYVYVSIYLSIYLYIYIYVLVIGHWVGLDEETRLGEIRWDLMWWTFGEKSFIWRAIYQVWRASTL